MEKRERRGRTSRKRWLVAAVLGLLLAASLIVGARKLYLRLAPDRLVKAAEQHRSRGDIRNAALTARRALQIDKEHLGASRLMAAITEQAGESSLDWRRRIVELHPVSLPDRLALAAAALRFENLVAAEDALAPVRETAGENAEYRLLAGTLAVKRGKLDEARDHYRAAMRLQPGNPMHQFNLASIELRSADPKEREMALVVLKGLLTDPQVRKHARRTLVNDLAAQTRYVEALQLAREIRNTPDAEIADQVSLLDLLHRTDDAEFSSYLGELKKEFASKPEGAGALVEWHGRNGMAESAVGWTRELAPAVVSHRSAGLPIAGCHLALRDWRGLQAITKDANWGSFEYLRHTYLARALRELGDESGFRAQWGAAVSAVAKRPEAMALTQLANEWGWQDEMRDLLWAIAKDGREPEAALGVLYRHYGETKNTRGLQRVVSRLLELNPSDPAAMNNVAMFSLLLKTDIERAANIARDLYVKERSNPVYASTYAYALHLQDRSAEALEIMRALPPDTLNVPEIALYHGVILAANDRHDEALPFLAKSDKPTLLPEERELLIQAREQPAKPALTEP